MFKHIQMFANIICSDKNHKFLTSNYFIGSVTKMNTIDLFYSYGVLSIGLFVILVHLYGEFRLNYIIPS